jgi:hypothetical protein
MQGDKAARTFCECIVVFYDPKKKAVLMSVEEKKSSGSKFFVG